MSVLYRELCRRAEENCPIRIGVIGAGKFGCLFLAQARRTPGLHLAAIADLRPERVSATLSRSGWPAPQYSAPDLARAVRDGTTWITEDAGAVLSSPEIEVIVEATGAAVAGVQHAAAAIHHGKHVVMVNVEGDVLAGPLLARQADAAGVVYTLAYGDQPALICELVDWARTSGFRVVAAGKGTRHLPRYHYSTPDTVWDDFGIPAAQAVASGMNPQMFNSFLDGTKSAIEMAAVANATGLTPAPEGLGFPPCGVPQLPVLLRPRTEGGALHHAGQVEVVSCLHLDGSAVADDLRWGVYVVFAAEDAFTEQFFREYGLITDESGRYAALHRPYHLVGMELGISVARAALRGEPTGAPERFVADVSAVAKRDLAAGEVLDGEGGTTIYGRLAPAAEAVRAGAFPAGLSHGVRLARPVRTGATLTWDDVVAPDEANTAVRLRREMEASL